MTTGRLASACEFTVWSVRSKGERNRVLMQSAINDLEEDTVSKVKVTWKGRIRVEQLLPALDTDDDPSLSGQPAECGTGKPVGGGKQCERLSAIYNEAILDDSP